ncbi:hypothetical protein [Antiquaquibacter soli]|uniref:DUF2029 domain-containing protein n=1 Tax=Antiquaquibacter soli TaxID=3064523 RepID=A0ABT9BJA8_9MICO|nr:hypothetical protein [Protaetiibacter sp. WY-16]MDO7881106.1 hypothetical protein [Protaetiibacter sp. WY-16]
MIGILGLVLFVLLVLPIALLVWDWVPALFASALLAGLIAIVAVPLHLTTGMPMVAAWILLVAVAYAAIAAIPRLRRTLVSRVRTRPTQGQFVQLAVTAIIVMFLVALPGPPTEWDARSIWLFHASWLDAAPSAYLDAQSNPALLFSHPGYPLLAPAAVATVWSATGGENLVLGLRVIAILTTLTGALAASTALERLAPRARPGAAIPAFALFVGATVSVGGGLASSGYVDALQAGTVILLLALLIPGLGQPLGWRWASLAAVAAVAAVSVKQEGVWFALAVLLWFAVASFRQYSWPTALPFAGLGLAFVASRVFASAVGAPGESDSAGVVDRLPELLDPSSAGWATLQELAALKLGTAFIPAIVGLALLVALLLIVSPTGRSVRQSVVLAGSWVSIVAIIALTYVLGASSSRLEWWLGTSYDRITATPALILWFTAFSVIVITVSFIPRKAHTE